MTKEIRRRRERSQMGLRHCVGEHSQACRRLARTVLHCVANRTSEGKEIGTMLDTHVHSWEITG